MNKLKEFFKKKIVRIITIIIIVLIVVFLVLTNTVFKKKNVNNEFSYTRTVTLTKSSLNETIVSSGTIESQTTSTIAITGANATVSKINYVIGDYVKEGDVIVELDTSSISKQISKAKESVNSQQEQLEDNYSNAYSEYASAYSKYSSASTTLSEKEYAWQLAQAAVADYQAAYNTAKQALDNYVSEQMGTSESGRSYESVKGDADYQSKAATLKTAEENLKEKKELAGYDNAKQEYESASQSYSSASSNLDKTYSSFESASEKLEDGVNTDTLNDLYDDLSDYKLKAKSSGQITSVNAVVGSSANGTLATIQDTSKLKISLTIDEYDILKLKLGMKAIIETDATDTQYEGEVSMISPTASSSMGSSGFEIEVKVTSEDVTNLLIGMNAEVTIILNSGDENYSVPVDAVETRDGKSIIYVQNKEGEFEELEVTTGENNGYYIEIFSDELYEGMKVRASADEDEANVNITSDDFSDMSGSDFNFFGGAMTGGGNNMPQGGGNMPSGGGNMPSGNFGGR